MIASTAVALHLQLKEQFLDLSTQWIALRMEYQRMRGEQPGEETQAQKLERIRKACVRRRRQ